MVAGMGSRKTRSGMVPGAGGRCKSLERRSTASSLILRDEAFWLPLIAVFSGLRQEEIGQLHVADIQREDGMWFFDINKRPPRMLKN